MNYFIGQEFRREKLVSLLFYNKIITNKYTTINNTIQFNS